MGKAKKPPEPEQTPAPVSPEDAEVRGAGQRKLDEMAAQKGRLSTYIANPGMRTGFAGMLNKKTGGV